MPDLTKFLDLTLKRKNTDENLNIEEEIHKSSRRIIATLNSDDRAILNNYISLVSEIFDDCALVLFIIENEELSSKFDLGESLADFDGFTRWLSAAKRNSPSKRRSNTASTMLQCRFNAASALQCSFNTACLLQRRFNAASALLKCHVNAASMPL